MVNAKTFLEKRYNDELELEDAVHTAILTLKVCLFLLISSSRHKFINRVTAGGFFWLVNILKEEYTRKNKSNTTLVPNRGEEINSMWTILTEFAYKDYKVEPN